MGANRRIVESDSRRALCDERDMDSACESPLYQTAPTPEPAPCPFSVSRVKCLSQTGSVFSNKVAAEWVATRPVAPNSGLDVGERTRVVKTVGLRRPCQRPPPHLRFTSMIQLARLLCPKPGRGVVVVSQGHRSKSVPREHFRQHI